MIKHILTRGLGFPVKYLPPRGYLFGETISGPWVHPVLSKATNAIQIDANNSRITANAYMPRIELDGDTDIDPPADNERIEVEG